MPRQRRADTYRPVEQLTTAIEAMLVERIGAERAESAFERTDECAGFLRRKIGAATFTIGAHFEYRWRLAAIGPSGKPAMGETRHSSWHLWDSTGAGPAYSSG